MKKLVVFCILSSLAIQHISAHYNATSNTGATIFDGTENISYYFDAPKQEKGTALSSIIETKKYTDNFNKIEKTAINKNDSKLNSSIAIRNNLAYSQNLNSSENSSDLYNYVAYKNIHGITNLYAKEEAVDPVLSVEDKTKTIEKTLNYSNSPIKQKNKTAISKKETNNFSKQIAEKDAGLNYYIENQMVTAYSNNLLFAAATPTTLTVITSPAYNITTTKAILGGEITDDGGLLITERGVCYSLSENDNDPEIGDINVTKKVIAGTEIGDFSDLITELTSGNEYSFKAYAINTMSTAYGSALTFTTVSQTTGPATWEGDDETFPTDWSVDLNWSTSETPTSTRTVIIPTIPSGGASNMPIISSGNQNADDLTIEAGASLTINDGASLAVAGDLLLETPSGSGASGELIIPGSGTLTVTGTSTLERYYLNTNYWRYVTSPVTSPDIRDWAGFYANEWNASNQDWDPLSGNSSLSVMQGISVVDSLSDKTVLFSGTFNNDNQSINTYNDGGGEEHGWNLVGNPYPSAIDWGAGTGITRTNVDAYSYVYNSSTGSYSLCSSPCIIAAGQGFMIHSGLGGGTLAFSNASRTSSTQAFRKNGIINQPTIKLEAKNEKFTTEAFVAFNKDATNEFDSELDAFKLLSDNKQISDIYTIISSGSKLAMNTLNINDLSNIPNSGITIPIGLTPGYNGYIELAASKIENLDEFYIYLYDKQKDIYIDLRTSTHKLYIGLGSNSRLELVIKPYMVNTKQLTPNILIYNSNKIIYLKSELFKNNKGLIEVYDISGRLYNSKTTEAKFNNELFIKQPGTYIVRVFIANSVINQKVIVQ